jgi:hypothetical protein
MILTAMFSSRKGAISAWRIGSIAYPRIVSNRSHGGAIFSMRRQVYLWSDFCRPGEPTWKTL